MIDVVRRCVTAVAPSHADHSPANCLHVPNRFSDIPDKLLIQLKMWLRLPHLLTYVTVFVGVISIMFGAVDKTSSSFSAHGKISNFIIIIIIITATDSRISSTPWMFYPCTWRALAYVQWNAEKNNQQVIFSLHFYTVFTYRLTFFLYNFTIFVHSNSSIIFPKRSGISTEPLSCSAEFGFFSAVWEIEATVLMLHLICLFLFVYFFFVTFFWALDARQLTTP